MVPAIGRIVHYKPDTSDSFTEERPAVIVRVWADKEHASDTTAVQLQVFVDGDNDGHRSGVVWKTSRLQGSEPGQWHGFEDCG